MACKKTTTSKKTTAAATVTVTITVNAPAAEKLYIVGSTENLGAWDAAKAVEVKAKDGKFSVAKKFDADAAVEFKVLAAKDWAAVEKDGNGYDVANHAFTATKGTVVEVSVAKF